MKDFKQLVQNEHLINTDKAPFYTSQSIVNELYKAVCAYEARPERDRLARISALCERAQASLYYARTDQGDS